MATPSNGGNNGHGNGGGYGSGQVTKALVIAKAPAKSTNTLPAKIDPSKINMRRSKLEREEPRELPPPSVSAGPVDKVIELAFNPSREKIREVTIIDRLQGRLFPIMDVMNTLYLDCMEVAMYRQSKDVYKEMFKKERPTQIDIMDEFMYRVAQWQKSVAGKNLEKATDIALAETETRSNDDEELTGGGRGFDE